MHPRAARTCTHIQCHSGAHRPLPNMMQRCRSVAMSLAGRRSLTYMLGHAPKTGLFAYSATGSAGAPAGAPVGGGGRAGATPLSAVDGTATWYGVVLPPRVPVPPTLLGLAMAYGDALGGLGGALAPPALVAAWPRRTAVVAEGATAVLCVEDARPPSPPSPPAEPWARAPAGGTVEGEGWNSCPAPSATREAARSRRRSVTVVGRRSQKRPTLSCFFMCGYVW